MSMITDPKTIRDRIRGSLVAGAAGDALGYAVEFTGEAAIFRRYGPGGIRALELDRKAGCAVLSDDTQMTLFTAAGILDRAAGGGLRRSVANAYQMWLLTQEGNYAEYGASSFAGRTPWLDRLLRLRALHVPRAPGNTCLSALGIRRADGVPEDLDFIGRPVIRSKGCGGIMRTAPAAWIPGLTVEEITEEAAQYAAVTHSHPGGWLPSAAGAEIVYRMTFTEEPLAEISKRAILTLRQRYGTVPETEEFCAMLERAVSLAKNDETDLDNVHALGEGWVGDEALAIALYCALRHENDLSACLISAVNHKGDSDSTGAIAGNILGARVGYAAMDQKWKQDLELREEILSLADALAEDWLSNAQ